MWIENLTKHLFLKANVGRHDENWVWSCNLKNYLDNFFKESLCKYHSFEKSTVKLSDIEKLNYIIKIKYKLNVPNHWIHWYSNINIGFVSGTYSAQYFKGDPYSSQKGELNSIWLQVLWPNFTHKKLEFLLLLLFRFLPSWTLIWSMANMPTKSTCEPKNCRR